MADPKPVDPWAPGATGGGFAGTRNVSPQGMARNRTRGYDGTLQGGNAQMMRDAQGSGYQAPTTSAPATPIGAGVGQQQQSFDWGPWNQGWENYYDPGGQQHGGVDAEGNRFFSALGAEATTFPGFSPDLAGLDELFAGMVPQQSFYDNYTAPYYDQRRGFNAQKQGLLDQQGGILSQQLQNNLGIRGMQRDRELFPNNQNIQNYGRDAGLIGDTRQLSRDQALSQQESSARQRGYQATSGGAGGYLNAAHRADRADYRTQRDQAYQGADLSYRGSMNGLNDQLAQSQANVGFINQDYGYGTTQDQLGYNSSQLGLQGQGLTLQQQLADLNYGEATAADGSNSQAQDMIDLLMQFYQQPQNTPAYLGSTG